MSEENPNPASPSEPPQPKLPHQVSAGARSAASPQQIYVMPPQSGPFKAMFSWLGWLIAGLCLMAAMGIYRSNKDYFDNSGGIQEKYHSLSKEHGDNKIAVIKATGMIMSGDGFVKKQIDQVRADKSIKGIVLRVDSPGGTVYGSDFMYHHLVKLREERNIPMVVSMGSIAASGGYYIAMAVGDQEEVIYAEPMTTTGSIGVIIPHYNFSGLMKKLDIVDDSIATHPRKNMLSMTKEMSADDRKVIGKYIGHAFNRFKDVIKSGRPQFVEDEAALDTLATGEVFTAKQALEFGLVDKVGFIEDAVDRVLELASLDKETTRVVTYKQPTSLVDAFAFSRAASRRDSLSEALKLASPNAYYLAAPWQSAIAEHFSSGAWAE